MLFRLIYDDALAQAAYLIGCQRTGEAIVIDPERDVDRYVELARREELRITAVAETHIHADFLSGARQLARDPGAHVYLPGEGGPDWSYQWPQRDGIPHTFLRDGDEIRVGAITLRALHTPGHTPEHVSFLVTDHATSDQPMGVLSGDFVFVGDVGRPDLLESAVGTQGAKEPAARALRESLARFDDLPDFLQLWPAHGSGSACGKALGAVPQSTLGYERRVNPALALANDPERFVSFVLADQPEPPMYFARMKRENKSGPALLDRLPRPRTLSPEEMGRLDAHRSAVLDCRAWTDFRAAHLPGALAAPWERSFPTIAGSYVGPEEPIALICDESKLDLLIRMLVRIGLDNVEAWISPDAMARFASMGGAVVETSEQPIAELDALPPDAFLLDVRRASEFRQGHIEGAANVAHTRLPERMNEIPRGRPIAISCRTGQRSACASALLQRAGYEVINLAGGYAAYADAKGLSAPA